MEKTGLAAASRAIAHGLESPTTFVGRLGQTEASILTAMDCERRPRPSAKLRIQSKVNAGVWPPTTSQLKKLADEQRSALGLTDVLGEWGPTLPREDDLLSRWAPKASRVPLAALDPVGLTSLGVAPWTYALSHKSVLVISGFAKVIPEQYAKRSSLFRSDLEVLPAMSLISMAPPMTHGLHLSASTWSRNLQEAMGRLSQLASRVDIALVSAGAYGMPLSAHLRRLGVSVVYMGGALQLLFGIAGRRWRDNAAITAIQGSGWVEGRDASHVRGGRLIEGGAYW